MIAYAITDPSTLHFHTLERDIQHFSQRSNMIVYRDKSTSEYAEYAKLFLAQAQMFDKVLLHTDYTLAKELGADGVHLTSTQNDDIARAKDLGLFVIVSTHSMEEAKSAARHGADMITLSPIFSTPNKGIPIGLEVLKNVVKRVGIPVIALGGIISQEQIDSCVNVGAKGFASIRYFERKVLNSL